MVGNMTDGSPDSVTRVLDAPNWLVDDATADLAPEYHKAFRALVENIWNVSENELEPKIRELVAVVVLAYRGYPTVGEHLRRALDAGASFRELIEALQTVSVPAGFPAFHYALADLRQLQEKLGDKASEAEELQSDPSATHSSSAWSWLVENYPEIEESKARFLSLLWTPTNPVLSVKYREVLASVILACRAYPTIDDHLRRAVREGATVNELVEAMQTAAIVGGSACLHFALPNLVRIQEELEAGTFV